MDSGGGTCKIPSHRIIPKNVLRLPEARVWGKVILYWMGRPFPWKVMSKTRSSQNISLSVKACISKIIWSVPFKKLTLTCSLPVTVDWEVVPLLLAQWLDQLKQNHYQQAYSTLVATVELVHTESRLHQQDGPCNHLCKIQNNHHCQL